MYFHLNELKIKIINHISDEIDRIGNSEELDDEYCNVYIRALDDVREFVNNIEN